MIEKHRRVATIKMSFGLVYIFSGNFMCIYFYLCSFFCCFWIRACKTCSSDDRVAVPFSFLMFKYFFMQIEHNCKCEYCPLKFSRIFSASFFNFTLTSILTTNDDWADWIGALPLLCNEARIFKSHITVWISECILTLTGHCPIHCPLCNRTELN